MVARHNDRVTTPSERIWAVLESESRDDPGLRSFLPARAERPETLESTAIRVAEGLPMRDAVADFLDELAFARDDDDVQRRIEARPRTVDPHTDAYLAALAEHVAAGWDLPAPRWAVDSERFLDHFWWPSRTTALRARAVVESPAAFRRRGIFIGATTLQRV
jgi:hypothetical protein